MANWKFFLDGNEVEEPIGWDAIEFTAIRMDSHGIDQPFSTEVKFYAEGARYIKRIYDQYFINQPIAITITSDVGYGNAPYQFDGFLNLAIYEEVNVCDTDSWEITVGIIDDEFREKFKARQEIDVDLTTTTDLDGNTIDACIWDNTRLHKQELYLVGSGQNLADIIGNLLVLVNAWSNVPRFLPLYWQNSDFKNQYGSTLDSIGGDVDAQTSIQIFKNNSGYTRTLDFNWSIKGQFEFVLNSAPANTANIKFEIGYLVLNPLYPFQSNFFNLVSIAEVQSPIATIGGGLVDFDLSLSGSFPTGITNPTGDQISIRVNWGDNGAFKPTDPSVTATIAYRITDMCLKLSEKNNFDFATFATTLTIEKFIRRLIYIYTGSNNKLLSDTFSEAGDGCYWNNALTNGLRIRNAATVDEIINGCTFENLTLNNSNYEVSFKSIFESLDSIFCLGWAYEWTGSEWKIRVESREYFYQNTVSQSFPNVGEVSQSAKVDKLANQIIIGYDDKWKNINTAGIWAIHTNRNYFIGNRAMAENSSAKIDLRSEIIAEGYAIEISRKLQFFQDNSGSSDRPNDYNTFIIWLNRNTLTFEEVENTEYAVNGESGALTLSPGTASMSSNQITASNSPVGAIYNIYHTPARLACRWWKVIGMHTYGLTNPVMRFVSGQYQVTYSSTINGSDEKDSCIEIEGGAIAENSNISAAILKDEYKDYLFRPIEVTFSYPQSLCDFLTLSQDEQYKKVRLTSGSLVIEGFITSATNQPEDASGGTTQFTLLYSNLQSELGGAFDEGFDDGYDNGG